MEPGAATAGGAGHPRGHTALLVAASRGHVAVLRLLLEVGFCREPSCFGIETGSGINLVSFRSESI
jgi:hypothetical protein